MSGLFSSLKKELNVAANTISKEANYLATSASNAYNEHRSSPELDLFRSGNVVQLVSRSSGRTLQIVQASTGQLVVDGLGPEGGEAYHAHWTVVDEGKNIVKLHNNNNFLAVVNGSTQILNFGQNPVAAGVECKFRLSQNGQFVLFESVKEGGCRIGVLPSGELKSALATGNENDAHFGIRLIYRPAPAPAPAAAAPAPTQKVYVPPGSSVTVVHNPSNPAPPPYSK